MGKKVLVLNYDFSAIAVTSMERAFVLVYMKKADLVLGREKELIRSISKEYTAPSIIRLLNYVHVPYKGVVLTRNNIFKRDNFSCLYCDGREDLTIDHVLPKSRGGQSSWTNLATACRMCNSRKGDKLPNEANMKLRYHPFKPNFLMFLRDFSGKIDERWHTYLGKKD